jgi:serine/threonine protein kinase
LLALLQVGQGTYSIVYKARDLDSGKVVALKKVRFVNMDPESVRFMAREIHVLRRLDHPNVIRLQGIIASRVSQSLYLVFEYMEHDLSGLIASPGLKLTEPQVVFFLSFFFAWLTLVPSTILAQKISLVQYMRSEIITNVHAYIPRTTR